MTVIKAVHTVIALVNTAAIFYMLYCGLRRTGGFWLNVSFVLLAIELVALALGGGECPLQLLARRMMESDGPVRDTFLPDWFASNLVAIMTPLAIAAVVLNLRNGRHRI